MQIADSVIRLDLANSSDHTKAGPIVTKYLTRLGFAPTFVVANKVCWNKHFFLLFCVKFTSLQLPLLQNHGLDVTLNLFVGLGMSEKVFFCFIPSFHFSPTNTLL